MRRVESVHGEEEDSVLVRSSYSESLCAQRRTRQYTAFLDIVGCILLTVCSPALIHVPSVDRPIAHDTQMESSNTSIPVKNNILDILPFHTTHLERTRDPQITTSPCTTIPSPPRISHLSKPPHRVAHIHRKRRPRFQPIPGGVNERSSRGRSWSEIHLGHV